MRIYTKAGDLAFKTFTFPDGQPHFKLETYEIDFRSVVVETSIRNPTELFEVLVVNDVLRRMGYSEVSLDIRYLMGARMDRAISSCEPFTLDVVARLLNFCGFSKVRILDVHSEVATRLIRNSENVLPHSVVNQVLETVGPVTAIAPDKGAVARTIELCEHRAYVVPCSKIRDPETGALSGFKVGEYSPHVKPGQIQNQYNVLIVDDICDGGGTFVGLAKELRKAGAKKVYLYVTHGIFSKGLPLEGIDKVFTTDSYCSMYEAKNSEHRPFVNCSTIDPSDRFVVIPISMKEL